MDILIDIAEEFSRYPYGLTEEQSPFSAVAFREKLLLPRYLQAVEEDVDLLVSLDGVKSFSSAFLEVAFGGLVKEGKVDKDDLSKRLKIIFRHTQDQRYYDAILRHINNS